MAQRTNRVGRGWIIGLVAAWLLLGSAGGAHAQDADGDSVADSVDNCDFYPNPLQEDADGDGIGDVCQCGDLDGDFFVTGADIAALRAFLANPDGAPLPAEARAKCAVIGEAGSCNILDLVVQRRAVDGFTPGVADVCRVTPLEADALACLAGICTIQAAPGIVFDVLEQNVTVVTAVVGGPDIDVVDTLELRTPIGPIIFAEAALRFLRGPNPFGGIPDGFETMRGSVELPFPTLGFLSDIQFSNLAEAEAGIDLGANLAVGVPLQDALHYLFFTFSAGLSASLGPITLSLPVGASGTMVLNPLDPFFYIGGGGGLGGLLGGGDMAQARSHLERSLSQTTAGDREDIGFGFSFSGLIPYVPETTFGIEGLIPSFNGHLLVNAVVPLLPLPLELDGIVIFELPRGGDPNVPCNLACLLIPDDGPALGGNGSLAVSIPFLSDLLNFSFKLGDASVGMRLGAVESFAFFSGVADPNDPLGFLPFDLPIPMVPTGRAAVAGLLSDVNIADSFVRAEADFGIGLGRLGLPFPLGDLSSSQANLLIDRTGFRLTGMTSSNITPLIDFGGGVEMEVFIAANGLDSSVFLDGTIDILGAGLDATLDVSSDGFFIDGTLSAFITEIDMSGEITGAGIDLMGSAVVGIPFAALDPAAIASLGLQIIGQEGVLAVASGALDVAIGGFGLANNALQLGQVGLDLAQAEVNTLVGDIANLQGTINSLNSQIAAQFAINCGNCTGCGSCFTCCGCQFTRPDCCACEVARGTCLAALSVCCVAEAAACEVARAASIAALGVSVAGVETAKLAVQATLAVANLALDAARLSLTGLQAAVDSAVIALNFAQANFDQAGAVLAALEDQLDNLEPADFLASVTIDMRLNNSGLGGAVSGQVFGNPIVGGRVFLGDPPEACFTLVTEWCVPF